MDEVFDLIRGEEKRQKEGLELIPSENYVSGAVLAAMGSVFTNKYSEGYPGRRYYGGQEWTDKVEELAIERAKKLFGADHANVQSHSGANANEAVYFAWCEPGDTILAMDLKAGGHLTHGAAVTRSAREYNFIRYGVTETGELDYEGVEKLALEHQPKIFLVGYSAYMKIPDFQRLAEIGKKIPGCLLMADMSHVAGLIAGGAHPNPLEFGFQVMTTTTHKTLRGPRGGLILTMGEVLDPLKKPEKKLENIPTLVDRAVFPGTQGGPLMNMVAAKAVAFGEALRPEFKEYAERVVKNAEVLSTELMRLGFELVGEGTENHLILIDMLKSFGVDGKEAEMVLDRVGLTANANAIPGDILPAFRPSGLRIGTPAMTTRGMGEEEMRRVAKWMREAIVGREDNEILERVSREVKDLALQFGLPE